MIDQPVKLTTDLKLRTAMINHLCEYPLRVCLKDANGEIVALMGRTKLDDHGATYQPDGYTLLKAGEYILTEF